MNDVTTATGCAVSRRSARIFWESPRALMLLAERSKEDERLAVAVAVASATAKRDIMRPGTQVGLLSLFDAQPRPGFPVLRYPGGVSLWREE